VNAIQQRIDQAGPKKILACDGGGIRGLLSVEILLKLEAELRHRTGQSDLVLADFFDFVCGTSTGAIIATCIAAGMSMSAVREFYVGSGRQMFERASILERLRYKYNDEPLANKLREELNRVLGYAGDAPAATLGDPRLRTVLMIVMRNHSTDSPWPLSNNPGAMFNQRGRPDCNLDLPLWQLVRASAAAPTFFPPEVITLAEGSQREYQFVFMDGGVTSYNNPAFLAFQMATAAPYAMNWATGEDRMLIVSVGTGTAAKARPDVRRDDVNLYHAAIAIPAALMNAASAGWDMACRLVGQCRFGPPIDREIGDMIQAPNGPPTSSGPKLFTYVRYDPDVTQPGIDALGLPAVKAERLQVMDSVDFIRDFHSVGAAYAEKFVRLAHLEPFA